MLANADLMAFVGTANPDRAAAFYGERLGLRLVAREPFALVFEANGTMLRISILSELNPLPFTVLGWEVPDIARVVDSLAGRGVAFERFEDMDQNPAGIFTFPDGTRVAWFRDPDGNLLSLTQFS